MLPALGFPEETHVLASNRALYDPRECRFSFFIFLFFFILFNAKRKPAPQFLSFFVASFVVVGDVRRVCCCCGAPVIAALALILSLSLLAFAHRSLHFPSRRSFSYSSFPFSYAALRRSAVPRRRIGFLESTDEESARLLRSV